MLRILALGFEPLSQRQQLVRPIARLKRSRIGIEHRQRQFSAGVISDSIHIADEFGFRIPCRPMAVSSRKDRRHQIVRRVGWLLQIRFSQVLNLRVNDRQFAVEIRAKSFGACFQIRLHAFAFGGADFAQPAILQHREQWQQNQHGCHQRPYQPGFLLPEFHDDSPRRAAS